MVVVVATADSRVATEVVKVREVVICIEGYLADFPSDSGYQGGGGGYGGDQQQQGGRW